MTRLRTVMTFVALTVLGVLCAWAAWGTYGFAESYADPTASSVENLTSSWTLLGFLMALLIAVAVGAVSISRGALRRPVIALSVALVAASAIGMVAGNHYGLQAKQRRASVPPPCGIDRGKLNDQWQSLDHAGYFGGGEESASHCSYQVTARDLPAALTHYREQLEARAWRVSRATTERVEESRDGYRFEAAIVDSESAQSPPTLSVTMRADGK